MSSLWLLLYLALAGLRGKAPDFREADGVCQPAAKPRHRSPRSNGLFSPGVWPKTLIDTNTLDPFFTRYFIPPARAAAHDAEDRSDLPGLLPLKDGPSTPSSSWARLPGRSDRGQDRHRSLRGRRHDASADIDEPGGADQYCCP